ncbi:hypothetical protein Q7689_26770, partial [Nocardiopsis tropica]|nr:hypothetical protein [Nocardiopsis tropica]
MNSVTVPRQTRHVVVGTNLNAAGAWWDGGAGGRRPGLVGRRLVGRPTGGGQSVVFSCCSSHHGLSSAHSMVRATPSRR